MFGFSVVPHRRPLHAGRLDTATAFPLAGHAVHQRNGALLKPWKHEAEKYRVGVVHEFLSLTLEKRAMIHHIVEFKEEFGLTRHMYESLQKQNRAFYLAGTEMNWALFLRAAYDENGVLKEKGPLVLFNEKLQQYACMSKMDSRENMIDAAGL